jgi:hypothetical protein
MVLDGVFAQATLVIKPITVQHLPFEECLLQPELTKAATHHPQLMKMNFRTYEGCNTSPPIYENEFFLPSELSKTGQITPEVVLKNYNKLQKNHKMKNQIMLDFKLVVLHSEHTIWNALVHIFFVVTSYLFFSP